MAITRPYTAQSWETGDVITKEKLTNIEDALEAIDSEITDARGNGSASGTLGKRIDDLVMVQDTQPTSEANEIWVRSTGNGVQVPTYEEFEDLVENTVHVNEAQSFTDTQKAQARNNISAASQADVVDLKSATTQLNGELFDKDPVDIFYTQNNYALTSTGLYVRDYNAITEEYYVGDCSELYVEITNKGNFGGLYIFQRADKSPPSSGTNANLVGEVGTSAYTGILSVPVGALYLYVTKTSDTTNTIAKVARKYVTKEAFNKDIASTQSLIGSTADLNSYITNNYKLISGGLSERDYSADTQTYTLDVNDVYLYLDVEKYSDVTFFFQNRSNFPPATGINANIVGDIHNTAFKGIIEVPRGAKYLFVSQRKSTTNVVKKYNYSVVKSLKAYDIVNLNAFQQSAIQQSRRRLNDGENKYLSYPPILSFLHFSDLHMDSVNLARIMEFYNAYDEYIDDILASGDQVNYYSDGMSWWDAVSGTSKILTCIGNHEVVYVDDGVVKHDMPQSDVYQTFLAPYIANWGVSYTSGLCYYYKDYASQQVRLIVLDCMLSYLAGTDDADQLAWFTERLSEAKTSGYSVIVMEHYPANTVRVPIKCNFTDEVGEYGSGIGAAYQNAVQSFIDGGGDFVCYIVGHVHFDTIHYNEDYPSQLFVCVANAGVAEQYSDFSREYNDKSQDCFNIMSIDPNTKTIKLVRIGADFDNYLRHRGTLCINYTTKAVISET